MAYLDDLCGPNHRDEKEKLVKEIFRVIPDYQLAEDAVSDEIEYQLRRYKEGKVLPSPTTEYGEKNSEYAYHKNIIKKNSRRRAIRKLIKYLGHDETGLDTQIENPNQAEFDNRQAWDVLIEGRRLLTELERYNIRHPRGKFTERDIQIWADHEWLDYPYEDIQSKFEISYETARQIVCKVEWGKQKLFEAKEQKGEAGMYAITITGKNEAPTHADNSFPNQSEYLIRKWGDQIMLYEKVSCELIIASEEGTDAMKNAIEELAKTHIEKYSSTFAGAITAIISELAGKGDITEGQYHELMKLAENLFEKFNKK